MKVQVLCLSVLIMLVAPALPHAQAPVLMPGPPPLTEEMIGRFAEFFEWAFDVRLTNDQVDVLRKYSIDTWTKRKKDDMDAIVNVVALQVELSKADRQQLAVVRANYEPQVLESMRKQPNEPMAVWALAVYESSHKVLAPGAPPLTRQTSDAFLEALFLMVGEVSGQRGDVPDEKLKNDWAAALTSKYAQMPDDLKKQIAGMPLFVAQMRLNWGSLPEAEKAKYRAAWADGVKALLPASAPAGTGAVTAVAGKRSVADMMAEQNRRHNAYMSMSSAMMSTYRTNFNAQANSIGSAYRYW
ncbi:MAG: hypothetical protein WCP29_18145 [Acidobacteriota bacterium]